MNKFFIYYFSLLLFITITSCSPYISSSNKEDYKQIYSTDFCNIQNFENKLIKTNFEYYGLEEYWSAFGKKKCKLDGKVNINFKEFYDNNNTDYIEEKLLYLKEHHSTKKALIDVIGVLKKDTISRFGHLNSYPYEILVKKIKINIVDKN